MAILSDPAGQGGDLTALDIETISRGSAPALLYLVGPGSLLAVSAYALALQRLPTTTASTYAYVNPVVAVVLGALLLKEAITSRIVIGAAVVLTATAVTLLSRRRTPAP